MTKRNYAALLYADDKDVHDLLSSEAGTFTRDVMRRMAARRGIFVSANEPKADMVDYISQLFFFDADQIQELLSLVVPPERREASKGLYYPIRVDIDDVQSAAEYVKKERSGGEEDIVVTTSASNDRVTIRVRYSEFDWSRARMTQRRIKDAVIECENHGGHLRVVCTPSQRAQQIVADVVARLTKDDPSKLRPQSIDMSSVRDARLRTMFFVGIFKHLTNKRFINEDVVDVRLHFIGDSQADDREEEPEDDDTSPRRKFPKQDHELKAQLRNAAFQGANLLMSPQYQELERAGYFISHMVWSAESGGGKEQTEFEAWFHDAKDARDFRYRIRSVSDIDPSTGKVSNRRAPDQTHGTILLRILEEASQDSWRDVEQIVSGKSSVATTGDAGTAHAAR